MATHGSRAGEVTQDQTEAIMRNLVIVCVAASTLTGCTMVGAQCVTATYAPTATPMARQLRRRRRLKGRGGISKHAATSTRCSVIARCHRCRLKSLAPSGMPASVLRRGLCRELRFHRMGNRAP
jgi:hypothetical protein